MATLREAAQMALETLDNMVKVDWHEWDEFASVEDFVRWAKSRASFTAEALRAALAQPEQEPVAWISNSSARMIHWSGDAPAYGEDWKPLYTAPPQLDVPETAFGKMPETINMKNFVGSGKPLVPVCWMNANDIDKTDWKVWAHGKPTVSMPLFTVPPQREWVGLTLDEIYDSTHGFTRIQKDDWVATDTDIAEFAHIIEARLKAKNT